MPTYEYKCKKCEHLFELFQSMSDDPVKTCPECKGEVERLIGAGAGLIFKGSGFYTTDYRSDSYQKAAKADKSKASSSSTKKDAKKSSTSSTSSTKKKAVSSGK